MKGVLYAKLQVTNSPNLHVLLFQHCKVQTAIRWSKFPLKKKKNRRLEEAGLSPQGNTVSEMWNPSYGGFFFSLEGLEAVSKEGVWSRWPIPIVSPNFHCHKPLFNLCSHFQSKSANEKWNFEVENSSCEDYLWKYVVVVNSLIHSCDNMIMLKHRESYPNHIAWVC